MPKIGIIGAGTMGGMHADCYSEIPDAQVMAVADGRIEVAKAVAAKHSAKAFASGDEVIAMKDLDIVDVCLPTPFHKENVLKAAAAGKHVFCEKPIARNMDDGREMIAACKALGDFIASCKTPSILYLVRKTFSSGSIWISLTFALMA